MIQRLQKKLWAEEEGQDLAEYALLLSLICLISVMAMRNLATGVNTAYCKASGQVAAATFGKSGTDLLTTAGPTVHTDFPHETPSQDIMTGTSPVTSN